MDRLLRTPGFIPFLLIAFLNAFVDLGHKIIIQNTLFKIYDGELQVILTALVNGLILLPFVLLFTPAGFIADRHPKPRVMRFSAAAAIGLTLLITLSYYQGWFVAAFAMTFLLAIQSAFYSPAKYGYIKELTGQQGLAKSNALVQAVTITAILSGIFLFSVFFEYAIGGAEWRNEADLLQLIAPAGWLLVACSILEYRFTLQLPVTPQPETHADTGFSWQRYGKGEYLAANLEKIFSSRTIWLSIVGLSIFWGISQVLLASFPAFAKAHHGIDNTVLIQGLLACSGIGIMLGSLLAGRVSRRHIETGLIPLGAGGIVTCLLLLPQLPGPFLMAVDFTLLGVSGGFFIVPLNALIQFQAKNHELGTVLAGNNWVQNVVMLAFLGLTLLFSLAGFSGIFLLHLLTATALAGALYTLYRLPHSLVRLLVSRIFSTRYRIDIIGFEHIPSQGAVLMLGNHISWLDWAMLQIACPRPIRFVMHRNIYNRWYLNWLFRLFGAIPIAGGNSQDSLLQINRLLKAGEVVCLFPEGAISRNGQLGEFKPGYQHTVDGVDGVILPFYLHGLWGSRFSRSSEQTRLHRSHGWRRDIIVAFGSPLPIATATAELKQKVIELSVSAWDQHTATLEPVPLAWLRSARRLGHRTCLIDGQSGNRLSGFRAITAVALLSRMIRRYSPEPNIGLLLPTSSAGLIANLAVLLQRKRVVNLNYTASIEALKSAIQRAGISSIYTSTHFIKKLKQRGIDLQPLFKGLQVHYLETLREEVGLIRSLVHYVAALILPPRLLLGLVGKPAANDEPAAILFSSGSEGEPKGVVLSHRNIMGNIRQVSDVLDTREGDRVMATLPLFHAFGLTVTGLMPLVEGIPVVTFPDPADSSRIARAITRFRATIYCGTSSLLRLFTRNRSVKPTMLEPLRIVVAGAERLQVEVRDAFERKFNKPIYEGYGTTETTPVVSVNIPDRIAPDGRQIQEGQRRGTVGLPLPGSSIRIVDPETLDTLPRGEDGLILIGGTQLMQGYLKEPEKSRQAIVELDGMRWYRSGDKGHLDGDGFLTIVDRYARFAKIAGEMVSLAAVENRIQPLLEDAGEVEILATSLPGDKKGEIIILLVAGMQAGPCGQLQRRIRESPINPLMKPTAVIPVERIPRLGTGKRDLAGAKSLARQRFPG
ncbi:MAG: acyl-[ACP]--phospholipid O-acyltransferase [Sedimenticola sp.]|nr:acyl-[ACP]--phospholipid O-acyltransferase [Sedimenticola sp.]